MEPNSWLRGWSRAPVCQSFGNEGLGLVVEDHRDPTIWINPLWGEGGLGWRIIQGDLDYPIRNLAASRPESNPSSAVCQLGNFASVT